MIKRRILIKLVLVQAICFYFLAHFFAAIANFFIKVSNVFFKEGIKCTKSGESMINE